MKTGDGATHRGFESHSLRQKSSTPAGVLLFWRRDGIRKDVPGPWPGEKKCPVDTFLVRGRIPGFPNAVRRTVGGKANAMNSSPTGSIFLLTKRRDSKGRPRRSLGKSVLRTLSFVRVPDYRCQCICYGGSSCNIYIPRMSPINSSIVSAIPTAPASSISSTFPYPQPTPMAGIP